MYMIQHNDNAMTENATARLSVMMTPQLKEQLETRARRAGITVSELVRKAVEAFEPEPTQALAKKIADLETRLEVVERVGLASKHREDVHA
jgi:predicted DNA-binding protein